MIFAPVGRDAAACAKLTEQVGLMPTICPDIATLIGHLEKGADVVLLARASAHRLLKSLRMGIEIVERLPSLDGFVRASPTG